MRMHDIINAKKRGLELNSADIKWLVDGFTCGEVPDYQMSAFLMAVYFQGMSAEEITALTMSMAESGEQIDLSELGEKTVEKHSTGGVGDKTTLIVVPIVAALGIPVVKISGRGLGHTGGTLDKLESILGFNTNVTTSEFIRLVKANNAAIVGQTGNLAPADKKIYALRDVTGTVDSIPLIAASVMSKKIASGAKNILLDVKYGSGAFIKDIKSAQTLADIMTTIGRSCGRRTEAVITDMNEPLGYAVGNMLEVLESLEVLRGEKNAASLDLINICIELAAHMYKMVSGKAKNECVKAVEEVISNGSAYNKFTDIVKAQGGNLKFSEAKFIKELTADNDGIIVSMNTEEIGLAAMTLGAGRAKQEDSIDHTAGIKVLAKTGAKISKGQVIAELHTSDECTLQEAEARYRGSIQ